MRYLLTGLERELSRGTLVFPSQIAVDFWRRHAISDTRQAVREDHIISWDTFKESAFDLREERVPANRIVRTAFVDQFIRSNAADPQLSRLIPPAFARDADGFARALISILPRVPAALGLLAEGGPRINDLRRDLRILQDAYTAFLDRHGMYEPRWMPVAQHFRGGAYVLAAPELADDFGEFQSAVAHLPRLTVTPDPQPVLTVFPDSVAELRATMQKIAGLLAEGVDPETIYVTAADFDRVSDRIRHEARKFDVPISLGRGRSLADSAIGRLLASMSDAVATGFGLPAVESLLLNRAIPWKHPAAHAELVVAGAEHGCLGGRGRPDPRWAAVQRAGISDTAKTVLARILRLVPGLVGAASFSDLRVSFNEFLSILADRTSWNPEDERLLERCQEELRSLVRVEHDLGLSVERPFDFWSDRLADQRYVPQRRGTGVMVLPYKVGALVCPDHHFVIGVNHAAARVAVTALPFLTDADRSQLSVEPGDRDLTEAFLDAYGVSGRHVEFSAAHLTHEGSTIPAGYFLTRGRKLPASPQHLDLHQRDPYVRERDGLEFVPTSLQVSGARAYARVVSQQATDFTRHAIDDPTLLERVFAKLRGRSDRIPLSSSTISVFRLCPFQYLLSRGLGISELQLTVDADDPAGLGSLYHDILAAFFGELAASGESFEADNVDAYLERLQEISAQMHRNRYGTNLDIVFEAQMPVFRRIAERLLDHDAAMIDGHTPLLVEEWRQEAEAGEHYRLVGRIDRATRAADGTVSLVDYKKSSLPSNKEINAGSRTAVVADDDPHGAAQVEQLGPVQIPLYVRLIEAGGSQVSEAGYYSLEKAKYLPVISQEGCNQDPCMDRERFDQVLGLVDDIIRSMTNRIDSGRFMCDDRCEGCEFRAICRARYHVR